MRLASVEVKEPLVLICDDGTTTFELNSKMNPTLHVETVPKIMEVKNMSTRIFPRENPVQVFFSDRLMAAEEGFLVSDEELSEGLTDLGYSYIEAIESGWLEVGDSYEGTGWSIFFLGRDFDGNTQWECVKVEP